MSGEKSTPSLKGEYQSVPLPVHGIQRRTRRGKLTAILTIPFVLYGLHIWCNGTSSMWYRHSDEGLVIDHSKPRHGHHKRPHHLFGKRAEQVFLSIPNGDSAIAASRQYATKPHMAGTNGDLDTAKDFLKLLQDELGISPPSSEPIFAAGSPESQHATLDIPKAHGPRAWIDTYYPVMNTPLDRRLQILDDDGKVLWDADLKEYSDETDPEAAKYSDDVPTFHGLSKGGDVTGQLVDGNYCTKDDYDSLVQQKTNLKGSIVICRYGGIFRGLKVKGGQEVGAAGVLVYSDPRDDGTVTIENGYKAYPHGPARNPTSVQRGSVQFLSVYPGDPTTPGYPSYENSTRTEGENIPSIPSLPISWANAEKLLKALQKGGTWEGKQVRLLNNVDTRVIPIWNTMGVIPGHIKNEVVVLGNHRDAWVMGAADPTSGTVSVHEAVRGFGHLVRKGWKPLRTIVIASWDAEEYGLIGSTEWGEDFAGWIDEHVVSYVNLDSSVSGSRFSASGSPLLSHFIRQAALDIPHPTDPSRTLWDARSDSGEYFGLNANGTIVVNEETMVMREMEMSALDSVGVGVLGSGSDYTVFLQRNGVPSTNGGGFSATLHDPVYHYHSIFDSERWQEVYADPRFFRHVASAKHVGLQVLRIAGSIVLPFNTTHYAYELESYLDKVEGIAAEQSIDIHFNSLRKSMHSLQKASTSLDEEKVKAEEELRDILKKWRKKHSKIRRKLRKVYCRIKKALGRKCKCPGRDKAEDTLATQWTHDQLPQNVRIGRLPAWLKEQQEKQDADIAYGIAVEAGFMGPRHLFDSHSHGFPIRELKHAIKRIQTVNKKLSSFERGLISEDGIKEREWFKHLGVAPGKWLGYGATTLPGLTESLTFEKNVTLAQYEADRLTKLIDRISSNIKIED